MKTIRRQRRLPPGTGESGIALVLTLLLVAILTVLVVGFNASVRSEAGASRNFNAAVQASQMADLATATAVTGLAAAFTNTNFGPLFATMPGLAVRVTPGNNPQVTLFPLVSTNSSTNTGFVDMNRAGTNGLIHPDPSIAIPAAWVEVTNARGEIIGRYAFWVDDESTKVNINAADFWGNAARPSAMPNYQRFFELGRMPGTNEANFLTNYPAVVSAMTNSATGVLRSNRTAFHISQAAQTVATNRTNAMVLRWLRWNATAFGSSTNLPSNLWGTNGWNLNSGPATNYTPLANDEINWSSSNSAGVIPINEISTNQSDNLLSGEGMRSVFGSRSFVAKYSPGIARQIAANIDTFWRMRRERLRDANAPLILSNVPGTGAGYQWGDGGTPPASIAAREDRKESNTWDQHNGQNGTRYKRMIPKYYAGRDLSPMLIQVDFQVTYLPPPPPPQPGAPSVPFEAALQIRAKLFNPYETDFDDQQGAILVQLQKFRLNIPQASGGDRISWSSYGQIPKLNIENVNIEGGYVGPENESGASMTLSVNRSSYASEAVVVIPLAGNSQTSSDGRFIDVEGSFPFTVQQAPGATSEADLSSFTVGAAYVIVDSVRYLSANPLDDPGETSVKDWISGIDFRQVLGGGSVEGGQMNFADAAAPIDSPVADWQNTAATISFHKNDPRVRSFATEAPDRRRVEQAAWSRTSDINYDQPIPGPFALNTDNTTRSQTFEDFERLVTNRPTAGSVQDLVTAQTNRGVIGSIWDLGQIHTGLPWRTLRFGPTEAGVIPDWALLELYWPGAQPPAGSPFRTTRLNVNSRVYAASRDRAGAVAPVISTNGTILARQRPVESLLAAMTNGNNFAGQGQAIRASTNYIFPQGASQALGVPGTSLRSSEIDPQTLFTNLAAAIATPVPNNNVFELRWSPDSSYGQDRSTFLGQAASSAATTDVIRHTLFTPLELLEIRGLIDPVGGGAPQGNAGDFASESRMKILSERTDVRGSAFTVWSVGQALKRETFRGNTVTNVIAESARETVFGVERDTAGNLRIVPLFTQPIVYK